MSAQTDNVYTSEIEWLINLVFHVILSILDYFVTL